MLTVRASMQEDVDYLSTRLRKADVAEIAAAGSPSPRAALQSGLHSPGMCLTAVDELGWPVVMFGVSPHPSRESVGVVWALATPEVVKHRVSFLRQSRDYTRLFHATYRDLWNYTDCRNTEHHRWLQWCGFEFINRVRSGGPGNLPFYEFNRRRDHV